MDENSTNSYSSIVYNPKAMHHQDRLRSLVMAYASYTFIVKTIVILSHVLRTSMVWSYTTVPSQMYACLLPLTNSRPGMQPSRRSNSTFDGQSINSTNRFWNWWSGVATWRILRRYFCGKLPVRFDSPINWAFLLYQEIIELIK